MGLLKFLGLENEQKTNQALVDENIRLKADNLTLIGRLTTAESRARSLQSDLDGAKASATRLSSDLAEATEEASEAGDLVDELNLRIKDLESGNIGKKVTYASARKSMTKAKLKELRSRLEAVPSGAQGFCASVSVYDKKTKRLKVVELKSKAEALELVSKAEKGNVDIVI